MPLTSKPGAPRPKRPPPPEPTRRCLGPIDRDRFETLKASGELSDNDIAIIEATFRKLEQRS